MTTRATTRELYLALCEEPAATTTTTTRAEGLDPAPTLAAVARRFGTSPAALTGRTRTDPIVAARQAAMVALRQRGLSLPAIGRALGGRDHTTVLHGLAAAEARAARDADYAARLVGL